ncbi:hypothetical protein B0H17DRAFT_1340465 [Mycena rosella]|uniref:Uncharacterized protein n=1 Tax=Mycena rosella TaxID=1033263 RepID=A0AAD7BL10_MYCRO|nr:hypothetical protein B0H17DRAFT_1340465 [Mycena rosella]
MSIALGEQGGGAEEPSMRPPLLHWAKSHSSTQASTPPRRTLDDIRDQVTFELAIRTINTAETLDGLPVLGHQLLLSPYLFTLASPAHLILIGAPPAHVQRALLLVTAVRHHTRGRAGPVVRAAADPRACRRWARRAFDAVQGKSDDALGGGPTSLVDIRAGASPARSSSTVLTSSGRSTHGWRTSRCSGDPPGLLHSFLLLLWTQRPSPRCAPSRSTKHSARARPPHRVVLRPSPHPHLRRRPAAAADGGKEDGDTLGEY